VSWRCGLLELEPPAAAAVLKGDWGPAKTTLFSGLAAALGIEDPVTTELRPRPANYSGRREGRITISSI